MTEPTQRELEAAEVLMNRMCDDHDPADNWDEYAIPILAQALATARQEGGDEVFNMVRPALERAWEAVKASDRRYDVCHEPSTERLRMALDDLLTLLPEATK